MIKKVFITIVLFISLLTMNSWGKIRDFETTRLQSTSGAGVATILVNEASILNPAPIVFVPVSSFYYQKGKSQLDTPSSERSNVFSDGTSQMYLLSDSSSQLKGTFSYQDHSENHARRKRFTSSVATSINKDTSFGALYRYTIDRENQEEDRFHQGVFGLTHISSADFILGAILVDPFVSNKGDTRFIVGLQYALTANLFLIIDGGTNYLDNPEKNTVSRGALQVNFLKDLYLRAGQFHDKAANAKGHSWGVSWIGPRISLEYAYKISEIIQENSDDFFREEQIIETSLSFALIF